MKLRSLPISGPPGTRAAVLREYVSELRRDDHVSTWGRLNWHFHSILYSRANQPRFTAIIRNVNNSGERYTRLQLYLTRGMKRANEEHHEVLELCRQRDVRGACQLLRQHIRHAGESLRKALEQKRTASEMDPTKGNVQIRDQFHAFGFSRQSARSSQHLPMHLLQLRR